MRQANPRTAFSEPAPKVTVRDRRHGAGDAGVMAFTDFGIDTLQNPIQIYKEDPDLLKRSTDLL